MEVQAKEGLVKLKINLRIVSYLQFEDYFSKLEDNNLESKLSPTLKTQVAFVDWSLFE